MPESASKAPLNQYELFLSSLPEDWIRKRIDQVGVVVGGGTPSRDVPSFWGGPIAWVTPGEVSDEAGKFLHDTKEYISDAGLAGSGAILLPSGSLMVTTRATLGARVINANPMTTNQGFKSIIFSNPTEAGYYYHLFSKIKPELIRRASGTTFLEISASEFSAIAIPNPSAPEKNSINQILDTLDTAIHKTEAIVAKLKQVKQGLLHDLLTRGVDANGELRPSYEQAPELYQSSPLGWIPAKWKTMKLGEISISSIIGPFGSNLVATDYRRAGIPVVFVKDIRESGFRWISNTFVSTQKAASLSAHNVLACDVIATKMGLPPCVSAVYPESMPDGIITADILRFRLDKKKHRPHWISLCINEATVIKQVQAITAGVTRPKVTLTDARELVVRIPPVDEQDRILAMSDIANEKINLEVKEANKLQLLKTALMDDLLTGRVRVTPLLDTTTP